MQFFYKSSRQYLLYDKGRIAERRSEMKTIKKIIAVITVMLISTVFLAGCGGEKEASEPVTLNVGMAGKDIKTVCVILAKELGYYE